MGTHLAVLHAIFAAVLPLSRATLRESEFTKGTGSSRSLAGIRAPPFTAHEFCADNQGYHATVEEEYWLQNWPEFCPSNSRIHSVKWLPHFLDEQGSLNVCVRLGFSEAHATSSTEIEEIRTFIEEMVYWWQLALMDTEDWKHNSRLPVNVFGVAMTPNVTLQNSSWDVYVNDQAKCPDACSRFVVEKNKYGIEPNYSACDQPGNHFDIDIWTGDVDIEASDRGGDWGIRIPWSVFEPEMRGRQSPSVTLHELGHTAGLPDFDNWTALKRPDSIFWESSSPTVFDCMMLRSLWAQHMLNPFIDQHRGCERGFEDALTTHGCKACALCMCEWNGSVPCASYCADQSLLSSTTTRSTTLPNGFVAEESLILSAANPHRIAAANLAAVLITFGTW